MRRSLAAVLALVAVGASACSDTDDESSTDGSSTSAPVSDSGTSATARSSTTTTTTTIPSTASTTSTTVIPTVPESGVPGIDSDDEFCRAWSEFAGTFQALALASNLATDPDAARRAEVAAAPAVVAAVGDLGAALPPELEPERDALLSELVGPFARRAQRATDQLGAAGLSPQQTEALAELWLAALADGGVDDPDISVTVPDELEPAFTDAVATFVAEVPPIAQDPSLVTDARAPLTEGYLSANCPDQGTLGGNDVVDR